MLSACKELREGERMLIITFRVDAPAGQAIGIKEDLAYYLERFGDVKSIDVTEENPQQTRLEV